jgi:hypothetical protein
VKPLYLDWHLGLGDAIICNGLVRWLVRERQRHVIVPCYAHNRASVEALFADLPEVMPVLHDGRFVGHDNEETLSIGMNNPRWGSVEPFDRAFYEFAGVPFDAKWDLFHVPESGTERHPTGTGPWMLYHHDPDRGFSLNPDRLPFLPGVQVRRWSERITDWRYMIRDAAEIHCIDSSVMHLAELLPTTGKLFYHKYARAHDKAPVDAIFRKKWTVIE